MRRKDSGQHGLSIGGDEERPLPDAWRDVHRAAHA
jgi:hypothetical protein